VVACETLVVRGEGETRYRDRGGPWLYGAGFAVVAGCSVFFLVMAVADPSVWPLSLAFGVGIAVWAAWYAAFYVYEWTLRGDELLETRALLRHRVETVSDLEHDKNEDVDRWLIGRAGGRHRMRLSAKSGRALANALRARGRSKLIHDPGPPRPSPWWSKLLERLLDGP
jgi:hypothetical protein